jgi:hypothetical protein
MGSEPDGEAAGFVLCSTNLGGTAVKERWIQLSQIGLSSTASTLTQLLGVPVEIDLDSCRLGEMGALDNIYPAWCATTRVQGCSRQAGFLVPEALAVELGASLAMAPADEGFTPDVLDGLSEVINLMIGAWRQSPVAPEDRLSNDFNDRSMWSVPTATDHRWEEPVGLVSFDVRFQGRRQRMALFGAQEWLKGEHSLTRSERSRLATDGPHPRATPAPLGSHMLGE